MEPQLLITTCYGSKVIRIVADTLLDRGRQGSAVLRACRDSSVINGLYEPVSRDAPRKPSRTNLATYQRTDISSR